MNKEKLIENISKSTKMISLNGITYVPMEEVKGIIQSEPEETCEYTLYDDDSNAWECNKCGALWTLNADTPAENDMHFCPKCGRKVKAGE